MTSYSLSGKGLKITTVEEAQPFADEISALKNLETLNLTGNSLGPEAAKVIFAAVEQHDTLKYAYLSDIFTSRLKDEVPIALLAISKALSVQNQLLHLDLSDNAFGPNGARHILEYLSNVTSLEVLKLHNNGLGSGGAAIISEALTKSAKKQGSKLKVFICGRNRLENGAENIAAALSLHPQMEEIVIPQNGIRPTHIAKVVKTLTACTKLQVLDLEDNTLDEEGGCALADSLKSWPQLKVLNIGDCYLCKTGGKAVVSALTGGFESLEKINLVYNEIGTAEAALIPDMLRNKINLKSIQLNGNEFEEDGPEVTAIRRVLLDLDKEDALDELDDMQVDDEDTADEASDNESVKSEPKVDDLTACLKNVKIEENDENQTEGEDSPKSIHHLQKEPKFVRHNIREDSTLGQLNEFSTIRLLEEDQTDKTWLERSVDSY